MPEPEAVAFLRSNGLRGRLLTWFDYGEYAIWQLTPQFRVSFDGRRETVYSERVKDAHLRFYSGLNPAYPDEIGADYIWLPNQLPVVKLLPGAAGCPIFKGFQVDHLRPSVRLLSARRCDLGTAVFSGSVKPAPTKVESLVQTDPPRRFGW